MRKRAAIGQRCLPYLAPPPRGKRFEDLLHNLYEAVEGCLSVEVAPQQIVPNGRVIEIAV